jgi:hypothetical protein
MTPNQFLIWNYRCFIKEVEKQIYEAPEYYFWTHKRWNINGNLVTVILVLLTTDPKNI